MRCPALAPSVLAGLLVGALLLPACVEDGTTQPSLGCDPPADPLPGPLFALGELGDPSQGPVSFMAQDCVLAGISPGSLLGVDFDCGGTGITLELPNSSGLQPSGPIEIRVEWTEARTEVRVVDDVGPLIVALEGVIEPGTEDPLSWQIETNCAKLVPDVEGHLIVRTDAEDTRVDVGEVEVFEVFSTTWEAQTFAASVDLEAEEARGSVLVVRKPG